MSPWTCNVSRCFEISSATKLSIFLVDFWWHPVQIVPPWGRLFFTTSSTAQPSQTLSNILLLIDLMYYHFIIWCLEFFFGHALVKVKKSTKKKFAWIIFQKITWAKIINQEIGFHINWLFCEQLFKLRRCSFLARLVLFEFLLRFGNFDLG